MASLISFLFFLGIFNAPDAPLTTENTQIKAETHINYAPSYTKGTGGVWNDLEEH